MKGTGRASASLLLVAGLLLFPLGIAAQAGFPDLIAAVKAKDGPRVSRLLHGGADANGRDANGLTPLHYAATEGDSTSAMLLVAAGADPNAKDSGGMTPLHDAAASGSREVVNVLLSAGANPRLLTVGGLTPSAVAARNHHDDLAEFLRQKEATAPRKPDNPPPAYAPPPPLPDSGKSTLSKETGDQIQRAFAAGEWVEDIEAAQQFSKEKRRPILALFTGSDWCYFCKQLEAKVLSTSQFKQATENRYILLYVDFPRQNKASKEIQAERMRLAQKYNVRAYPTLVVLQNGDQELDRITGFRQGMTVEKYIDTIEGIAP